ITCGALSGFHATQSPIISRTTKKESEGRYVFYGMMIAEGIIAMIWAAAAMSLLDGQTLNEMIASGTPSAVVDEVAVTLLGDRKSTRLNSSHVSISYAVFCLKKKRRHKYQ